MQKNVIFKATVVGAGPAGLAIMGRLLSAKLAPILWIDRAFEGGKLVDYQKVPANTKTIYFKKFMSECPAFDEFLKQNDTELNPNEIFKDSNPDTPPILSHAYQMCKKLTKNIELKHFSKTEILKSKVESLLYKNEVWEVSTKCNKKYNSEIVILATGSEPRKIDFLGKTQIPLEALVNDDPEELSKYVNENDIVGVFGSSHSSVLALKHLEKLPKPPKKIYMFYREKIRYAVHTDNGIIYDNLGLKGQAAIWAKEYLEAGKSRIIEIHWLKDSNIEKEIYEKYLTKCTKIAPTIGFQRLKLPKIFVENEFGLKEIDNISYDGTNLKINKGKIEEPLNNIWGIGIAFPRHVKDLSGIIGMDVGIYKFGNAAKLLIEQINMKPKF